MRANEHEPLHCATCPVRERAACAALDEEQRRELARLGQRRKVAKGETVFAAGDDSGRCATLVRGALKIASHAEDGTERNDVIALTDSELCLFTKRDYEAAVDRFPSLAKALLRRSAEDLFDARSLVELQARRGAKGRVAGLLLAVARSASHSPCHCAEAFDLPLTRGEMGGLLGLTIETVSRQLTALEREGLIARTGPRGIILRDPGGLERIAA